MLLLLHDVLNQLLQWADASGIQSHGTDRCRGGLGGRKPGCCRVLRVTAPSLLLRPNKAGQAQQSLSRFPAPRDTEINDPVDLAQLMTDALTEGGSRMMFESKANVELLLRMRVAFPTTTTGARMCTPLQAFFCGQVRPCYVVFCCGAVRGSGRDPRGGDRRRRAVGSGRGRAALAAPPAAVGGALLASQPRKRVQPLQPAPHQPRLFSHGS